MNRAQKNRKQVRQQVREHVRMAKLLLPPTPGNCPTYTRRYFESYRSKLFEACRNSRHRHCPKTSSRGAEHHYCVCPCHLGVKLSKYKKRQMWLEMKRDLDKSERKKTVRDPNTVRATVGTKGQKKTFRYLHAPDGKIPAGIMHIVHDAISTLKQGTVAEVAVLAIEQGLAKITGQDPTTQTSVMLHRLLASGVVEVL